jgi:hypothetical protein
MNIEELKNEKLLLESNIRQLINDFNDKTLLSVYSINVNMVETTTMGDINPTYRAGRVSVMVNL